MRHPDVQQLAALSGLFKRSLDLCQPDSVAILGVAGGNGLEHVEDRAIHRIVGIDINAQYLNRVRARFGHQAGLELHCVDIAAHELSIVPVALVYAALVFEHAGIARALDNALSCVAPGGHLAVVLQLPSSQHVTSTPFPSIQSLAADFSLIDAQLFQNVMQANGFRLVVTDRASLPGDKALWFGLFRPH